MKDNTNIKKASPRPPEATAPIIIDSKATSPLAPEGEAAQETAQLRLTAFPSGHIFKFTGHPTEPGRFVLFDVNNNPVAVVQSAPIADLLCQSVKMLFDAVSAQKLASLTDEEKAANNAAYKAQHATEVGTGGTGTTCAEVERVR